MNRLAKRLQILCAKGYNDIEDRAERDVCVKLG
jgi:hypothetical protein